MSDLIKIVNSHNSLSNPFHLLKSCIKDKILLQDHYDSINFRFKNKSDILLYHSLHDSYPPLPCLKQILVSLHLIPNPYIFDYSGSTEKELNSLISEIYKKNLKRRKVVRQGSAFHNSIVRLKRIGSTHTDGSSFLKANQSNRQTSTFSANNENSLLSHSVSRDTTATNNNNNNTDIIHAMMMDNNKMNNNNNNNYYNNYTLTQHNKNINKYDRKRSVGSPSPLQQEVTESNNTVESDDSLNRKTDRSVNRIEVSSNSKKLSVGQVVALPPVSLRNGSKSIPSSSTKTGESDSTTQNTTFSCLSQDTNHTSEFTKVDV